VSARAQQTAKATIYVQPLWKNRAGHWNVAAQDTRTTVMTKVAHATETLHTGMRSIRAPVVLGQRASLLVSAGVVAHTLWTSAAPAMVCRLYAEEWHLSHTVTTGIFAIYPAVVVVVLIGFGDISDHIGRRATMLVGLSASLAGSLPNPFLDMPLTAV